MTVEESTRAVSPTRAAQELELRRDEFQLAVQLGLVRTVPAGEGGRRRVDRREIDRLKAAPDFPAGLCDRVRAVGTGEAAALLEITPERFTRLARTGHLNPVRFTLNRYRAVVWTYLAEEVAELGLLCPDLLTGRLPLELRDRLAADEDLRPRNWRARRLGVQLRATDDPWAKAAAIASLLDPVQVAEVVDDPYERHHLDRLRPPPPPGVPMRAVAARELVERLMRADDPDEILWHRLSLALALDEARAEREAPHPGERGGGSGGRRSAPRWPTAGWDRAGTWAPTGVRAGTDVRAGFGGPGPGAPGPAVAAELARADLAASAGRSGPPEPPVRTGGSVPPVPSAPPVPSTPPTPFTSPGGGAPAVRATAADRPSGRAARGGLFARFRGERKEGAVRRVVRRGRRSTWP